jgi:hypothetical protein
MAFAAHRRGANGRVMADSAIRSQDGCRSFNVTESRKELNEGLHGKVS